MPKKLIFHIIIVGMALGTAWAIRGQFGHEHGAAWAGGIGVLAILSLSRRADWFKRMPAIAALGAIGWGVGGMMSYGMVVGYGRGTDFGNVYYGLLMLFVIGALYGFIGGGAFGLALESSEQKKPKWASLITQMVAGGYLLWGILIYQLEWHMTPPRSELWAACLGAAFALGWYLYRNNFHHALRVALFSALGAGFGFAFGNFLQVMGNTTGMAFNWWNVMEYSLGFFGGAGMAYAVFSRQWPTSVAPDKWANLLGFVFLTLFLPITNVVQAFDMERMINMTENAGVSQPETFAPQLFWGSMLLCVLYFIVIFVIYRKKAGAAFSADYALTNGFLFSYLILYIILSNLITGIFFGIHHPNQYLYWVNLAVIMLYIRLNKQEVMDYEVHPEQWKTWGRLIGSVFIILALLALIAINSHGEMPGAQVRF